MEPNEFKQMVEAIRSTEKALGKVNYGITKTESKSRVFRRSLFVVQDIKSGERFTKKNIRSIRPGYGLHTRYLENIIGRTAKQNIKRGTPLTWDHVTNS
jgi:sialic acid synthase SpsE